MVCAICEHPDRYEIEQALMHLGPSITIESIAEEYNVNVVDLKRHAMVHSSLSLLEDGEEESTSIVGKIKMKEASMLEEVAIEYMITLKNVGRRINTYASKEDVAFEKLLTKPVADLYVGLGSEIRQTVEAIAKIDQILNGPKEDNTSGLAALAAAINDSRKQ